MVGGEVGVVVMRVRVYRVDGGGGGEVRGTEGCVGKEVHETDMWSKESIQEKIKNEGNL